MPSQKDHNKILMPIVTGLTAMLWGKTVLELTTLGTIHSPDLMADAYLAVMATYAGAGEWEKWSKKSAWNPEDDPWTERAQRGGVFLMLWSLPFFASYLWRLADHTVPYPAELKRIWTGLFTIFLAKNTSRSIRHSRKGLYIAETQTSALSDPMRQILDFLSGCPNSQATTGMVCEQFSDISRRHVTRLLTRLTQQKSVERTLDPETNEASYRLSHTTR